MHIDFHGRLTDEPEIRVGFIGCGSHAFRNLYPVFPFIPAQLIATCDRDRKKAEAFAAQFGAKAAHTDYREMIRKEKLDAVFVCLPNDEKGRPQYPQIATECLRAGVHVWVEKAPATECAEVERMMEAAKEGGTQYMVGFKFMYMQAHTKARELMQEPDFGKPTLILLERTEAIPTPDEFQAFLNHEPLHKVTSFLDHLCHPASSLIHLAGMPEKLFYERSPEGSGVITFTYPEGPIASLSIGRGDSIAGGSHRTKIVGSGGRTIIVQNNERVYYCRSPKFPQGQAYGNTPSYFQGPPESTTSYWEPEFTLGQLYSKGNFLLGYYDEMNTFVRCVRDGTPIPWGNLEHAWQVTRIFETVAKGPGVLHVL